jgi:hypothetical protein
MDKKRRSTLDGVYYRCLGKKGGHSVCYLNVTRRVTMIEVGFDVQSGYETGWHCLYRRSNWDISHE